MRFFFNVVVFLFFFVSIAAAQELTREQKVQKFEELNSQIKTLGDDIIAPSAKDLKQAQKEGFNVVRLLPRERYDHKLTVQGGGSYYSFTTGSHDYQKIAQVGLEQNNLKVGFAGVDYGFIADLSEMPLTDITEETAEMNFLINYKPPTNEADVRVEARKAHRFEMNGSTYKDRIPAVVTHSYILRAISFDRADVLVAFKVYRKDADGSLIIFWKLIKKFEVPKLERNITAVKDSETIVETIDSKTADAVQTVLIEKGLFNVLVEATNKEVILRGTVPKGKIAEAIIHASETGKRKVRNELVEQ
ncbi:MAG: hypothetical protein H0T08_07550 [Acidobacteria bacterium]|nr:hypothetical protein [Acidobacteriota bacterium]